MISRVAVPLAIVQIGLHINAGRPGVNYRLVQLMKRQEMYQRLFFSGERCLADSTISLAVMVVRLLS